MAEADGVTGADGGIAQGLGHEGLAHTGGTHQQDVLVPGEELHGEDGVQEPSVQGDGRGPPYRLKHPTARQSRPSATPALK